MASELLKNRALIQKLKEPEVSRVKFNLASTGFEELFTLPEPKPQELLDIQEDVRIQRQQDTMDKARPFLMDESVDFIEREKFDQGGVAKLLKYVEDLPKGSVVTRQMLIDFVEKNNLDVNIPNFISQKVPKIKNKKFITDERISKTKEVQQEYKKGIKFYEDKGVKPNIGSIRANVRVNKGKFIPPKGKLRGEKGLSGLFKNYEKTDLLKDLKAEKTPYEISIEYLDKNEKDILKTLEGKPDFSKPLKRLSTELTNAISKDKELSKLYKKILDKKTLTKKIEPKQYDRNVKTLLPIAQEQGLIPKVNSKGEKIDTASKYFQYAYKQKRDPIAKLFNYAEKIGIEHPAGIARAIIFNDPATLNEIVATLPDTNTLAGQTFDKYATGQAKFFERTGDSKYIKSLNKIINQKAKEFGKPKTILDVKEGKVVRKPTKFSLTNPDLFVDAKSFINEYIVAGGSKRKNFDKLDPVLQDSIKQYEKGETIKGNQKLKEAMNKILGQKKLTTLQKLASGKNVGFDPILATKAGFEEFVKPAAKIGVRGAAGLADLALSAGAGPIGLAVGALIETGQAMPELTKGNLKEAGRRTIIGSLLPESLVGSMQTDLLKLAETPEEKIAMQNFIDFKKDEANYGTSVRNLRYLEDNPFEAEGINLDILRNKVLEQKADLENRAPKVFFPEFAQEIFPNLVRKLDDQNVENLEGVLGSIVGRRGIDDRDQIIQDIGEQSISGQEPFYGQAPVQMSPEELDEIYESGIMAMANGGRIGFADGPDDPSRRTFLKIMGGIASLPIVGKFFKSAKVAKVVPLKNTTTVMPEWFPQFVEKALAKGVSKKIDADLTEIEIPELPDVKVRAHDDGRIQVEGKNAYNEEYYIDYEPPGYVVVDETTGKAVKKPGDFVATDTEYRMISPEDYDIDGVNVDQIDDILGGSSTKLEGFAKGTNKEKYTIGQKRIDEADARGASTDESLRADVNIKYGDVDPTDFADD